MRLLPKFFKKSHIPAVAPGMYGRGRPEQLIFDVSTRITVDRNHWRVATLGMGCIALAAIVTRQPAPSVTKVVGVSADASGKPLVRELAAYTPGELQLQWAFKDLVSRWFTIEPLLTTQIEASRMARTLRSVQNQMAGAARQQFDSWMKDDEPFRRISASPTLVREVTVTNVAILPDSTVAVELVTTTTEDGYKPRKERYAITFRYQVNAPTSDAALGTNPFGVHPLFFSIQKSSG
ncbi:type IV secretion system protein [Cupriavidus pauculus]|uniref:type IV secretion system protein n=1 Tax=Cupriavidus pauculus TaxID=82633 RepID=UPI001EE1EDE6|nr:type IV secretion system protein [Cupriavidus pauculus]GJG97760.1 type IV secretion system protein [Cupriavidus pauculus]